MYLILLRYTRPLAEVEQVLPAHRDYLKYAPGAEGIVMTGRHSARDGGLVMMRAASREAVEAFAAQDPYCLQQVARYEILDFEVAQVAPGLEALKGG